MYQSEFRHLSTETTLDKGVNDVLLASYKGCVSLLVLLDRLETVVGVKETALSWLRSYLTDYQFTSKW